MIAKIDKDDVFLETIMHSGMDQVWSMIGLYLVIQINKDKTVIETRVPGTFVIN